MPYVVNSEAYNEFLDEEKVNVDVKEFEPFLKDKKNLYNILATEGMYY